VFFLDYYILPQLLLLLSNPPIVNGICLLNVLCVTKKYGDMLMLSSFPPMSSIFYGTFKPVFHDPDVALFYEVLRTIHYKGISKEIRNLFFPSSSKPMATV